MRRSCSSPACSSRPGRLVPPPRLWRRRVTSSAGSVSFLVFGDPAELEAYRTLIASFEERRARTSRSQLDRGERPRRPDREAVDVDRRRHPARPLPDELPLLRPVRLEGRARAARGASNGLGGARRRRLLPAGARRLPLERRAQLCLPQNISSLVVYYNRDAVPAARRPGAEGRLAVERARARRRTRLTLDENGNPIAAPARPAAVGPVAEAAIYGLGVEPTLIRVAPFVWSSGRRARGRRGAPDAAHARHAAGAGRRSRSSSTLRNRLRRRPVRRRGRGRGRRVALRQRPPCDAARVAPLDADLPRRSPDFDWDVAPLPRFRQAGGDPPLRRVLPDDRLEAKDAAWRFVEFALGAEGQRIVARKTGRTVPSLREVAESTAFLDPTRSRRTGTGLPRRDPDDSPRAHDLDLAGDRGRRRRASSRTGSTSASGRRGRGASSTA